MVVCVCVYKIVTFTGTYSGLGFILKTIWRRCYHHSVYRWGKRGTVTLINVTRTKQLINSKTWIQIQTVYFQSPYSTPLNHYTLLPWVCACACVYECTRLGEWVRTEWEPDQQRGQRMGIGESSAAKHRADTQQTKCTSHLQTKPVLQTEKYRQASTFIS